MENVTALIKIEVCFALPENQIIKCCVVPTNSTLREGIIASNILQLLPSLDIENSSYGIFSKPAKLSDVLKAGDRIEIYRPLVIDPKKARRLRADKEALKARRLRSQKKKS